MTRRTLLGSLVAPLLAQTLRGFQVLYPQEPDPMRWTVYHWTGYAYVPHEVVTFLNFYPLANGQRMRPQAWYRFPAGQRAEWIAVCTRPWRGWTESQTWFAQHYAPARRAA